GCARDGLIVSSGRIGLVTAAAFRSLARRCSRGLALGELRFGSVIVRRPGGSLLFHNRSRRGRNLYPFAVEGFNDGETNIVLDRAAIENVGKKNAYLEFKRRGAKVNELDGRLRVIQHQWVALRNLKQHLMGTSYIGAIGDTDLDFHPAKLVAVRPVADSAIDKIGIGQDDGLSLKGLDLGGPDADLPDRSADVAGDDPVSDLERPFSQQDEPRNEVGHDILQAEADAEGKRACNQRQARQVNSRCRNPDQGRDGDAGIAHDKPNRVANACVDPASGHYRAIQPPLKPAR